MVKIYVILINKGLRTIDQVPENLREMVQNALDTELDNDTLPDSTNIEME